MAGRAAVGFLVVIVSVAAGFAILRRGVVSDGVGRAAGAFAPARPGPAASDAPSLQTTVAPAPPVTGPAVSAEPVAPLPTRSVDPGPAPAPPAGNALTPDELFVKASPAVVLVEVRDAEMKAVGLGSGFFVSADGLLVTNYHVIANASFAAVRTSRTGTMLVEGVAAADPGADLALLKVNTSGAPFLKMSDGPVPAVGTRVFAIGNPEGLTNTLSEGLVSGVRTLPARGKPGGAAAAPERSLIQTTAAISHGSSGGALLNGAGVVVGVTTSGIEEAQNLNFAVPADAVRRLIAAGGKLRPLASASGEALGARDAAAYQSVLDALDHGRFEQAALLMKGLSEAQRNTPAYWLTTGYLHYKLRNLDLAARAYREAIRLRPDSSAAYASLGDLYNFQNKSDPALEMYRKALAVNRFESRAFRGCGEVLAKQGKFDEAISVYDEGILLNPQDPEMLCRKAMLLGAMKRLSDAETTYRVALKLDPQRVDTYLYQGETYLTNQKWEKAIAIYQKALAIQPDNANAYCQLGVACYNARDAASAEAAWRSAHRFDPYGQWGTNARNYLKDPATALIGGPMPVKRIRIPIQRGTAGR